MEDNVLQVAEPDIFVDASTMLPRVERANNAWQRCPICDGAGRVTPTGITSATFEACPVCRGKMIINIFTGYPPA
jgi:hypothetical protein